MKLIPIGSKIPPNAIFIDNGQKFPLDRKGHLFGVKVAGEVANKEKFFVEEKLDKQTKT